jgi:CheY-like chemotaxis protein
VPSLEGVKVIVVEDDEDPRELLKLVLIRSGAEVSACSDPAEAMERFVKWTPDILISDIGLPGEDGYGLIRRVRGLTPERGGQIPAIALTAYSGESDKARILSAGFQMHITKPLDPKELVRAVSKLTGGAA